MTDQSAVEHDDGAATRANPRLVDALGKACPLPVIWLAKAVAEISVGEDVVVLADDPGAKVDIPVWCRMRRQEYRGALERDQGWEFTVRKVS